MENVEKGATVYSDALKSYLKLPADGFVPEFIDHAEEYVRDHVHTQRWKTADEQAFSSTIAKDENDNPLTDADRMDTVVRQCIGRRLTWDEVAGKDDAHHQ